MNSTAESIGTVDDDDAGNGLPKNSAEYWNYRFRHNWEARGGREQTRYFYQLLLDALPDSIKAELNFELDSVYDFGCALGDGLALIKSRYPHLRGLGGDHSVAAIEEARRTFSNLSFVTTPPEQLSRAYDVVVSSNTLEHFSDPWTQLRKLMGIARKYVVVLVPLDDTSHEAEHFSSFSLQSILPRLEEFSLLYAKGLPTDKRYWHGQQILLIYSRGVIADFARRDLLQQTAKNFEVDLTLPDPHGPESFLGYLRGSLAVSHDRVFSSVEREYLNQQLDDRAATSWKLFETLTTSVQARYHAEHELQGQRYRADSLEWQFHRVVQSARFKIGLHICETLKAVRHGQLRLAIMHVFWSIRGTYRSIVNRFRRGAPEVAPESNVPLPLLPNASSPPSKEFIFDTNCISGLVSVVLPVYNHRKFLPGSIESVLSQSYKQFELILVNDGSTENVEEVVAPYQNDPRVRYVKHVKNQRLPNALNTGFQFARGEFLTWTSADNLMRPDCLEGLVAYLRENPKTGLVFTGFELFDHDGNVIPSWTGHPGGKVYWECKGRPLNASFNYVGACFLYRHEVARIVGRYNTIFSGAEDYDYWMRISHYFPVDQHPDPNFIPYLYRFHDDSLTGLAKSMRLEQLVERLKQTDRFRSQLALAPLDVVSLGDDKEVNKGLVANIQSHILLQLQQHTLPVRNCPPLQAILWSPSPHEFARTKVEDLSSLRTPSRTLGCLLNDEDWSQSDLSKLSSDSVDFVITASPELLKRIEHPRKFFANPIEKAFEPIVSVMRSVISERLTNLSFPRQIPLEYGFQNTRTYDLCSD